MEFVDYMIKLILSIKNVAIVIDILKFSQPFLKYKHQLFEKTNIGFS